MAKYNLEETMVQNLKDAGCTNNQIQEIIKLYKLGKKNQVCSILAEHRKCILNNVHKNEKQINCLDYFIHQMEKEKK